METQTERDTLANVVAFVLALISSLLLLVIPLYNSVGSSAVTDGSGNAPSITTKVSQTTLLEENGPGVLVILGAPVLVTLLPLLVRRERRRSLLFVAAGLLTALCILTGFSIGLFFVPTAVAMWIAASLSYRHP